MLWVPRFVYMENIKKIFSNIYLLILKASPIDGPQTAIVNGMDVPDGHDINFHVHILLGKLIRTLINWVRL